jgi:hypothetical protein
LTQRADSSGKEKSTGNISSKAPSVIAIAGGVLTWERFVPYALFDGDRQVGPKLPTEAAVWKQALKSGLIADVPVADEAGGQVLPADYHVKDQARELRTGSSLEASGRNFLTPFCGAS